MIRFLILPLAFIFLSNTTINAQVKLQMDKFGKRKSMDFYVGDEITVKLKGEDVYQTLEIKKLYPDANMILTQLGPVNVDDIIRLRTFKSKKAGKYFSYMLWIFGLSWGGFSLIGYLVYAEPLTWGVLIVMGVSFLLSWLIKRWTRRKTYKIGKKRKLRIIDMTIEPFSPKP